MKWGGPKDFEWVSRINGGMSSQAGLLFLVFRPLLKWVPVPCGLWPRHLFLSRFWSLYFGFQLFFSDTSSLPRSRRDYMEALLPWDRAWLDDLDLNQKRKLVADSAISAYKTVVLGTMMAGYEIVPGYALESPADDMSRLLEEGDKWLWDLKASHQVALERAKEAAAKEVREAAERENRELNQKFAASEERVKEAVAKLLASEKEDRETKDSLSSFDKQVTDLCGEHDSLKQKLIDESSGAVAWKARAEEAGAKVYCLKRS
jgi:hypothetical protein